MVEVSIGEAIIITGFSMIVVFIVLIIISILISRLEKIGTSKNSKVGESTIKEEGGEVMEVINDEELVAVITAAIAVATGRTAPNLKIRKIKRISNDKSTWENISRQEQVLKRS